MTGVLAYFDSAEESFRTINASGLERSSPYIKVLGSRDNELVLQLDGGFYPLPRQDGDLAALPAPKIDGFNYACLNGDNITVLGRRGSGDFQPEPGELVVEEYGPHIPFEAAAYNLETREWRYLGGPGSKYDSLDFFVVDCVESDARPERGHRSVDRGRPATQDLCCGSAEHVRRSSHGYHSDARPERSGDRSSTVRQHYDELDV
jgi:hypothetical protein